MRHLLVIGLAAALASTIQSVRPPIPLDDVIADVCDKDVVLLGEEPHHGGGHTVEVKSELVRRLVTNCGFNAVYFESSAFEFFDFNRRLAAGTTASTQLADAIGGLWNRSAAIDPLVEFLYAQASTGRLRVDSPPTSAAGATQPRRPARPHSTRADHRPSSASRRTFDGHRCCRPGVPLPRRNGGTAPGLARTPCGRRNHPGTASCRTRASPRDSLQQRPAQNHRRYAEVNDEPRHVHERGHEGRG